MICIHSVIHLIYYLTLHKGQLKVKCINKKGMIRMKTVVSINNSKKISNTQILTLSIYYQEQSCIMALETVDIITPTQLIDQKNYINKGDGSCLMIDLLQNLIQMKLHKKLLDHKMRSIEIHFLLLHNTIFNIFLSIYCCLYAYIYNPFFFAGGGMGRKNYKYS